jgi:Uma2 family endonuclease
MSAIHHQPAVERRTKPLPLRDGMRMKQPEFHRLYGECPNDVKFELIGGIVYMAAARLRRSHSAYDGELGFLLERYRRTTPGTEVLHNATTILGDESEPQPDLGMRILPEYGGQSTNTDDDYVDGAPELLVEVSITTQRMDLRLKRADYEREGVCEYLVLDGERREIHWFNFREGGSILPNRQGVYRSRVFPGLWIDGPALLAQDSARLEKSGMAGLASREHAAFVKRLEATRRRLARHKDESRGS